MVVKTAPEVHGRHVNSQIGEPEDYLKNAESGVFATHYDLRIPLPEGQGGSSGPPETDEFDLSGALDAEVAGEEKKTRRSDDMPNDAFMPIKALNQFSSDWVIKARVLKKTDLRQWKNARGEGWLFNMDLVDR